MARNPQTITSEFRYTRLDGYVALEVGLTAGTIWFNKESRSFHGRAADGKVVSLGMIDDNLFIYLARCPEPKDW